MAIDWETRIANARAALERSDNSVQHPPPEAGSEAFAKAFDHTLLKPEATAEQVQTLCEEAGKYNFATVCIREPFVKQASIALKGTDVKVCCVVGFHDPTATTIEQKLAEARAAVAAGATELDMVIQWSLLKHGQYEQVYQDLKALRDAVPRSQALLKVILETSQLSQDDVIAGCVLASEAEFDFVKTSTGFLGAGAKIEDVRLMRQVCVDQGKNIKVKASGGVRTVSEALNMLQAGADRLGASASVNIMQEAG